MKKVWVLEQFIDRAEMERGIKDVEELVADDEKAEQVKAQVLEKLRKRLEENPDGCWSGTEGKSRYKDFCYVAKEYMRRNPDAKVRVVKAEIPEEAEYWVGYTNPVENEGVLRYLYATK